MEVTRAMIKHEDGAALNGVALSDLLDAGWRDAKNDPPENERLVQVAWDDGSTGTKAICFFDSKAETPGDGKRHWWTMTIVPLLDGHVLAWRELASNAGIQPSERSEDRLE